MFRLVKLKNLTFDAHTLYIPNGFYTVLDTIFNLIVLI